LEKDIYPEDGDNTFLQNTGNTYMRLHGIIAKKDHNPTVVNIFLTPFDYEEYVISYFSLILIAVDCYNMLHHVVMSGVSGM
jgi:hypothetical protein